jgi:thymidylate kinase
MGVNLQFIKHINDFLLKEIKIDFTFLNTVNKKNMKNRLIKRKYLNRYDKFSPNFYEKVQKGFIIGKLDWAFEKVGFKTEKNDFIAELTLEEIEKFALPKGEWIPLGIK